MKSIFRFLITGLLTWKAKKYLAKHRTQIIAVTGSIGKTSTKQAIYTILNNHFKTHCSKKGFNTEIGLALSILQEEESGFSSIKKWFQILKRVFLEDKKPYEKMVVEMGADHPGDIKKLVKIAQPTIGVITRVAPVHLADGQFKSIEDIAKEKNNLIQHLTKSGVAVLNNDDERVRNMGTSSPKILYGEGENSDLKAEDIVLTTKDLKFTVTYKEKNERFVVPVLGKFQIYTLLPAIAVGLSLGLSLQDCKKALKDLSTPPGRMNPIEGIKKSKIIDSSYNASPVAVEAALDLLHELSAERKIAALGTMNELGEMTKIAHLEIGKKAATIANILITVGPEAATLKQGAVEAGMKEKNIYTFFDSQEAGHFLETIIEPKDLILVKGSQNRVRMERLVKIIMKEPEKANHLLCRQGEEWERI